jgi:glycosyltransferase involved in cell wall biosynthesis
MCEGFANAGVSVELWIPISFLRLKRKKELVEQVHHAYGLEQALTIQAFPVLPLRDPATNTLLKAVSYVVYRLNSWLFAILCLLKLRRYTVARNQIVYTRHMPLVWLAKKCAALLPRMRLVAETHRKIAGYATKALPATDLVIVISEGLRGRLLTWGRLAPSKVLVLPDGIRSRDLDVALPRKNARSALGFEHECRRVIVYTGHLYQSKGVESLVKAMQYLSPAEYVLWIVGGYERDIHRLRQLAEELSVLNVRFVGYVNPEKARYYQAAADVLVLTGSKLHERERLFTSPLKLFEYMAAKRPIVAANTPAIREILRNEENALLVAPDDPGQFAKAIARLASDPALAKRLAGNAYEQVREYTWEIRAQRILEAVGAM